MGLKDLVQKHANNGGGDFKKTVWFNVLKNDADTCMVRVLHSNEDDLDAFEVHEVEVDGFKYKAKCLGDNCPICRKGEQPKLRIWISLWNLEESDKEKQVQLWERGLNDIKLLLSEIEENGDLNKRDYKIKRNGKKGDNKTSYQYFAKDKSERELPERYKILGRVVLNLNEADLLKAYNGEYHFPKKENKDSTDTKPQGEESF